MSSSDEVISYILTWYALTDACPKCRSLNMREYPEAQVYNEVVWDMHLGDIWNLNAGHSLVHPRCRCQLSVRVETKPTTVTYELERLFESLRSWRRELERRT